MKSKFKKIDTYLQVVLEISAIAFLAAILESWATILLLPLIVLSVFKLLKPDRQDERDEFIIFMSSYLTKQLIWLLLVILLTLENYRIQIGYTNLLFTLFLVTSFSEKIFRRYLGFRENIPQDEQYGWKLWTKRALYIILALILVYFVWSLCGLFSKSINQFNGSNVH